MRLFILFAAAVSLLGYSNTHVSADDNPAASGGSLEIFRQRIVPILKATNPSSCSECHLAGVDLKDYIRDDHAQTFAALRTAGLVNTTAPDQSKILQFIQRKPTKPNLITDKIRQVEYEAFRAWIHAAVKDPQLAAAKVDDPRIGPKLPPEVVRHLRADRVLDSFVQNVWAEIGRCAACHSPDRNQQQVKKFGEQVSWITLGDPRATMQHLLENELLDLDHPEKSLLLTKPTNQVKHGGGVKLTVGDRTYTQFHRFIADYAASKKNQYATAKDLPPVATETSVVTDIWFKLSGIPAKFNKQVLRVNLYRFDESTQSWSTDRWATGDRQIAGDRQLWQQHLSLTAPRESSRAKSLSTSSPLPPGRYLAKLYVDQEDRLQKQFPYELGDRELIGQIEINSRWPKGHGAMTSATFPMSRK